MADVLTLEVTEYDSPTEWRWELTGLGAEFLATTKCTWRLIQRSTKRSVTFTGI